MLRISLEENSTSIWLALNDYSLPESLVQSTLLENSPDSPAILASHHMWKTLVNDLPEDSNRALGPRRRFTIPVCTVQ